MSLSLIVDVLKADLPTGPKFVLIMISDFVDEMDRGYPGQETIALRTGMSIRVVRNHLKWLEENGYITRQARFRPNGTRTSDLVFVHRRNLPVVAETTGKNRTSPPADSAGEPVSRTCQIDSSLRSESPPTPHDEQSVSVESADQAVATTEKAPTDECEAAVERWNAVAADLELPKVQRLSDARKRKLRARLRECGGIDGWDAAMAKVRASPFLRGEKTDWTANFDFLLQESSFTKLMEGVYDDKSGPERPTKPGRGTSILAAAAAARAAHQARS